MNDAAVTKPRVLTATASLGRVRSAEEMLAKTVGEILVGAGCSVVRHVIVRGEAPQLRTLVQNISNDNEADAIVLMGGTGFGPKDVTCEALGPFFEKHIEGFAEAYRRLLRHEYGVHSMLARAIDRKSVV